MFDGSTTSRKYHRRCTNIPLGSSREDYTGDRAYTPECHATEAKTGASNYTDIAEITNFASVAAFPDRFEVNWTNPTSIVSYFNLVDGIGRHMSFNRT